MTRDSIRQGLVELALRVERITDFDTQERVDLNNALHNLLPEPKCVQPPNYLRSIDAAISLVPEGWSVKLVIHSGECHADVYRLGELITLSDGTLMRPYAAGGSPREGQAATPALALVAAALRAKAQS